MKKGLNVIDNNIGPTLSLTKGSKQSVEISTTVTLDEIQSESINTPTKKTISNNIKSEDLKHLTQNKLYNFLQDERKRSVMELVTAKDKTDFSDFGKTEYFKSMKRTYDYCDELLSDGINIKILIAGITPEVAYNILGKVGERIAPPSVYNALKALLIRMCDEDEYYANYYERIKSEGFVITPEYFARMDVACAIYFYNKIHTKDSTKAKRKELNEEYLSWIEKLEAKYAEYEFPEYELRRLNHSIVTGLIMSDDYYKRRFSHVYGQDAVNLQEIEVEHVTLIDKMRKSSVHDLYRPPIGGFTFAEFGTTFPYRFGLRLFYNPNIYSDTIFDAMKDHWGPAHKDEAYKETEGYKRAVGVINDLRLFMKDDNYSDARIDEIIQYADERCEMYYRTEVYDGIIESSQTNEGIAKPKFTIMVDASSVEWIDDPVQQEEKPLVVPQNGLGLSKAFENTISKEDCYAIIDIMNDIATSVNITDDRYEVDKVLSGMAKEPYKTISDFIEEFKDLRMNVSQKRMYDLLKTILITDAPAIDSTGHIIATRCIGDIVKIGDMGCKMHDDDSVISAGCWVDIKSGIRHSKIHGNVMILMRSSVEKSIVNGYGIIANTIIQKADVSGVFNESDMREIYNRFYRVIPDGTKYKSPIHTLRLFDMTITFGDPTDKDAVSAAIERIQYYAQDYKDFNIDDYVRNWQIKNNIKPIFAKY